jgi:hypothetical protein
LKNLPSLSPNPSKLDMIRAVYIPRGTLPEP